MHETGTTDYFPTRKLLPWSCPGLAGSGLLALLRNSSSSSLQLLCLYRIYNIYIEKIKELKLKSSYMYFKSMYMKEIFIINIYK